jgi:hypothetical protein
MALFLNLKKNKVDADLYYKGVRIATIKVNENNKTVSALLSLECDKDFRFKIIKHDIEQDESFYNKEVFNR